MVWYVVYWDLDLMMMLMAFFEMIPGLAGGLVTFFLAGRMFSIGIIIGVVWQFIWGWFVGSIDHFLDMLYHNSCLGYEKPSSLYVKGIFISLNFELHDFEMIQVLMSNVAFTSEPGTV